jgi:dihydrodipicolinate synthase/N-acetylneuraminate lyase
MTRLPTATAVPYLSQKAIMAFQWQGVFPALTTKFNEDDTLDLPLFEKGLHAQIEAGVHGLIVGGSLGEASVLTIEEKKKLVQVAVGVAAGKIPVIMNIAEQGTAVAKQQAIDAASLGAAGLMVLPPMRYKADDRETVTYFKTIAAATDLPVMIYNNPIDYKIDVTLNMFEELANSPNITAIKESTRDVTNVTRLINRFGDRFKILCGVDTLALEELCSGADGWVAGLVCAFPKETVAIYELVKANKLDDARKIYRWFMPLLELDIHPKLVQYIKLAESVVGTGSEYVRAPRLVLEGQERKKVLEIINKAIAERNML